MSHIRGRGNRDTEQFLARLLRLNHITGWRRHLPLAGKPDFAFPKQKVAVFVDGCFWHGCPKCYTRPKTNRAFWDKKREDNMARDRRVARELRARGWKVLRIWEHALKKSPQTCLARIRRAVGWRMADGGWRRKSRSSARALACTQRVCRAQPSALWSSSMSTLAEIEQAAGVLPAEQQRKLVQFLLGKLRKVEVARDEAVHASLLPLAATAWVQDWDSAEEDEAWRDL